VKKCAGLANFIPGIAGTALPALSEQAQYLLFAMEGLVVAMLMTSHAYVIYTEGQSLVILLIWAFCFCQSLSASSFCSARGTLL
jgi:hypothetical protein